MIPKRSAGHPTSPAKPRRRRPDLQKRPLDPDAGSQRDPPGKAKRRKTGGDREGTRRWVYSPRDLSSLRERFVIASYNILGVENASKHMDLYHQIKPEHLDWNRRKKRIRKELTRYNPNILCFQEVDRFDDLADLLQKDGYIGVYKARTGEASDGCAIFWKKDDVFAKALTKHNQGGVSRFSGRNNLHHYVVVTGKPILRGSLYLQFTLLRQENIEFRKLDLRDNVAQLCVFEACHNHYTVLKDKDANSQKPEPMSHRTLLVGNIHVLFNPKRGDIKLGQVRVLLEKAHSLSQEYGDTPVVIAGDLNSIPQSAIYQYITSSYLDILAYDRREISGQIGFPLRQTTFSAQSYALSCNMAIRMSNRVKYKWTEEEIRLAGGSRGSTCLQNPLKLFSAYPGVPGNQITRDSIGEPLATSCHSQFMGTVDYIWYSSLLVPVGVVETLPINILKKLGGLPSEKWGSDHLALVCEFAFADDANCADAYHDS